MFENRKPLELIRTPLVLFVLTVMALTGASALMVPATFPDVSIHRASFANTFSGLLTALLCAR